MLNIYTFSWNSLQAQPRQKRTIYAGDKIANSPDDQECGDGWISKEKDCHDGNAHRPEPGDNPYWTDNNSAEQREARDVSPEDNKPSFINTKNIDNIPKARWDKSTQNLKDSFSDLANLYKTAGSSDARIHEDTQEAAKELQAAGDALSGEDRESVIQATQEIQDSVQDLEAWLAGNADRIPRPEYFKERLEQAKFAVENLEASISADDPRDILVWQKIQTQPENLEVEDLLQLATFRNFPPDKELNTQEQAYVDRNIDALKKALDKWRESPLLEGAELANMFFKKPTLYGDAQGQGGYIEDSIFATNPKLALAILDRSARAGDRASNKALWEDFGLSEEWHPTSFLFDNEKAVGKATKELASMADWSGVNAADKELMLAGADIAEQEEILEEKIAVHDQKMIKAEKLLLSEKISNKEFSEAFSKSVIDVDTAKAALKLAKDSLKKAGQKIQAEAEKIREHIKDSLKDRNKYTQIDVEVAGNILQGVQDTSWEDIDRNDQEYWGEGQSLLKLRAAARKKKAKYSNRSEIQEHLQDLFKTAHKHLFDDPLVQGIKWETEVMSRAYAHKSSNSIVLSTPHHLAPDVVDKGDVALHEFAHHLEFRNEDIRARMSNFFEKRTAGKPFLGKEDHPDLAHYGKDEIFRDGNFFNMYCGRFYPKTDNKSRKALEKSKEKIHSTELLSMGVQALYNKDMWSALVMQDRQHLGLIIATLRGY